MTGMDEKYLPNPQSREPLRKIGSVAALEALLVMLGVKLAKLDPATAGMIATPLAAYITTELGRRFVWSPAKMAEGARNPEKVAVVGPTKQDPRLLRTYWPWFLAIAMLAFAGPEAVGIVNDGEGGTLSEWTRDALGTGQGAATGLWWAVTAGLVAFTVWFPLHLRKKWPWERQAAAAA